MALFSQTARWTSRTLPQEQANQPRRLLVVDDDKKGAQAIAASLCSSGYDAQFALGGPAVLLVIARWMPEIAVLDINMPCIDGFTLARQLRNEVRTQRIILLAFTAYDEITIQTNGIAAGFDGYCQKGTGPAPLLRLLEQMTA